MKRIIACLVAVYGLHSPFITADDSDVDVATKIRDEAFSHSKVMKILGHLTDNIGPRLTGSPQLLESNKWTRQKFSEWGLKNAHLESFEFGRGWSLNGHQMWMTSPRKVQVNALPISWLPSTDGVKEAQAIYAPVSSQEDFEKYRGKLKGKIVFLDEILQQKDPSNHVFERYDAEALEEMRNFEVPADALDDTFEKKLVKTTKFSHQLDDFLEKENAVAVVRRPSVDGMLVFGQDYQYLTEMPAQVPGVSMVAEHYDRAVRLMEQGENVAFSINVDVNFHEEDTKAYSTIAEIPGKGRNPEIVMAGAHLDSWFAADGAVDNGAGVAVVMEAARILKTIGFEPKRTVRFALWGGEEQGIMGSTQYVADHFAKRPDSTNAGLKYTAPVVKQLFGGFPIKQKPDFELFSVYFNLDNGSGKIRGIYSEGNGAAAGIFKEWFEEFHDLGAKTITLNKTSLTDHVPFDKVGLPAFQFIQDPLDYHSRLHHSQLDVYSHAYEKDLKQASAIMAMFIYNAAMAEKRMPRKPLPKKPVS